MTNRLTFLTGALTAFVAVGCVGIRRSALPPQAPKPMVATSVAQFTGLFQNRSHQLPEKYPQPLFGFITGRGHAYGQGGAWVAIEHVKADDSLRVRLLDEKHQQIDSADLRRDKEFSFSRGVLTLSGPSVGTQATSGNLGAGVERKHVQLARADSGDLIGRTSTKGAFLLFFAVPVIGGSYEESLWPRVQAGAGVGAVSK